ncbi:MAG: lytic murein transglycosylase, partial [Alphaproteobacteria bacterium]|nr:lytic murein transglycosylase [Alphaproteobacteria bacterium]
AQAASMRTRADVVWLQQLEQEAIADGVSPATAHAALDNFLPDQRVIDFDQKQPESTITFADYRRRIVTPARVRIGAELMRRYASELGAVSAQTGVPPQMIVALWGIESTYGRNSGDYETVNALATLAWQGRRADFFRKELFAALHILDREHMAPSQLRGSWAGAMGQCQFMPITYLRYASDGDGDGRRDIWNDRADVFASIANYLAVEGWRRGQSWGRPFDGARPEAAPSGGAQPQVVRPDGPDGAAFETFANFEALKRWNRSTYFALAAGLLADDIAARASS